MNRCIFDDRLKTRNIVFGMQSAARGAWHRYDHQSWGMRGKSRVRATLLRHRRDYGYKPVLFLVFFFSLPSSTRGMDEPRCSVREDAVRIGKPLGWAAHGHAEQDTLQCGTAGKESWGSQETEGTMAWAPRRNGKSRMKKQIRRSSEGGDGQVMHPVSKGQLREGKKGRIRRGS